MGSIFTVVGLALTALLLPTIGPKRREGQPVRVRAAEGPRNRSGPRGDS